MREKQAAQLAAVTIEKKVTQMRTNRMTEPHVVVAGNILIPFLDPLRIRHDLQPDRQQSLQILLDHRRCIRPRAPDHRLASSPNPRQILRRQRQNAQPLQFFQHPKRCLNPIAPLRRMPVKLLADRVCELAAAQPRKRQNRLLHSGKLSPRQAPALKRRRTKSRDARVHCKPRMTPSHPYSAINAAGSQPLHPLAEEAASHTTISISCNSTGKSDTRPTTN